jgi:hypothetical protein
MTTLIVISAIISIVAGITGRLLFPRARRAESLMASAILAVLGVWVFWLMYSLGFYGF